MSGWDKISYLIIRMVLIWVRPYIYITPAQTPYGTNVQSCDYDNNI